MSEMKGAQPAVRIGGKKAPRRVVVKKTVAVEPNAKLFKVVNNQGYKTQPVAEVENCSFIGKSGMVVNYTGPELTAIYHKDNQPIGYILNGKGELINKGSGDGPSFDLETVKALLAKKGIDIDPLMKKVAKGDKDALGEIITLLKEVDFSDPSDSKTPEVEQEEVADTQ
ncbi:hypothetical protein NEDG_01168 [Nematocida displodere]|uniref:Nascent polypeptide-associated complex subunit beta n=1 Tax=Nematocida displodere TaxID=1805483 RepID=A0A177EDF9_9MICR|nr:hypothetical protein NEDG_01168 [Nematocida displodere]